MPLPGFLAGWGLSPHLREQPLRDREAALALFPEWMRESESTTRDAIADGAVVAYNREASRMAAHAASSNPAYATGARLDVVGAAMGIPRAEGEGDTAYRARLLSSDERATVTAILAAIDAIIGDSTAYYYERPDDDAYLHAKGVGVAYGTFLGGAPEPIKTPARLYSARGRCTPLHVIMWRKTRGTVSTATPPTAFGAFSIRVPADDDATAPDNAFGHVILGLPAYLQPGKSLPEDGALTETPTAPLIDTMGNLTAAAVAAGAFASSLFTKATAATRAGAGSESGAAVYASTSQPDIVIGKVRALLESRAMAPAQFTLLFDPEVV